MSAVNQLLAKALSTTSEEEAMSCLRMARKKTSTFDSPVSVSTPTEYKGHDAKYWYDKASYYYTELKHNRSDLTMEQAKRLWRMYHNETEVSKKLVQDKIELELEIRKMKIANQKVWWHIPLMMFQFIIIITLVQLIR